MLHKQYPKHYTDLLHVLYAWRTSVPKVQNNPKIILFRANYLINCLTENGYEVINTRGLPFNGTTYEIRRRISRPANAYQVCGHIKHVRQIYGNAVTVYVYPPSCVGGKALNSTELDKYTDTFNCADGD